MSVTQPTLRVAILGDGPHSAEYYRVLTERTPGVEIAAYTDSEKAGNRADDTPDPLHYARTIDMDALIVTTATPHRASLIAAAVERGIPVCCPVPVVGDLSTLDSLILRSTETGAMVYAPNPLRHWLPLATLRERRKTVGAPISLFAAHRTKRDLPGLTGDLFTDLVLPLIDYAIWLVESEVERVQVMAERLFGGERTESPEGADSALIIMRFANGVVATLEAARSLSDSFAQTEEVSVEYLGRDAVLQAIPTNQAVTVTGTMGTTRTDWLPSAATSIVETFVETIRTGASAPQSLLDARWTLPVLEKVRLAAATGEMVRVGGALRR